MIHLKFLYIYFFALFFCSGIAEALGTNLQLNGSDLDLDVSQQIMLTTNQRAAEPWDAHEVLSRIKQSDPSLVIEPNRLYYGIADHEHWLHLTLTNADPQPLQKVLVASLSFPYVMNFFVFDQTGKLLRKVEAGSLSPWHERDLKHNFAGVMLSFEPEQSLDVLIQIRTATNISTNFTIISQASLFKTQFLYTAGYACIFGVVLALIFHNFTIFFSMRDKAYLSYLVFVLCTLYTCFTISNYQVIILPDLPASLRFLDILAPAVSTIGAAQFLIFFLGFDVRKTWIGRILLCMIVLCFSYIAISYFDLGPLLMASRYLSISMIVIAVCACAQRLINKDHYVWLVLLALICPMLSIIFYYASRSFGLSITPDIIAVGFTLEMLLSSMALSHRIYLLRKRQALLDKTQAELSHKAQMQTLRDMTSGIAHEVNNPLMIISGNSELVKSLLTKKGVEDPRISSSIERTLHAVDRIAFITNSIRNLALRPNELLSYPVNVPDMLTQVIEPHEATLAKLGIKLEVKHQISAAYVQGDPKQLSQTFDSLLCNAIEAFDSQSLKEILVSTRLHKEGKTSWLEITVIDSGKGIDDDVREKLFQPFFSTKEGSKGLSLSQAMGVVEAHGGKIYIDPLSKRTKFVVCLPHAA
jgi:signal transduction histidine kinase